MWLIFDQDPDITENIDTGLADHIEQLEEHDNGSMGVSVRQMLYDSWSFGSNDYRSTMALCLGPIRPRVQSQMSQQIKRGP